MDKHKPISGGMRRAMRGKRIVADKRAGFGVAPILYMLGLIGVGAGILFSSYSQTLKTNIQMTNSLAAKSDLDASATTLAATSVLGATDPSVLCPPQGGVDGVGSNCVNAPTKMIEFYPSADVTLGDAHLPGSYTSASSAGSPVEVGIFTPGSGVKQIDAWGHYYIYCRWESAATSTNPSMEVISAGPDGILQTKCGATVATGDDVIISMDASNAINRSAVWQTGTVGSSTPDVYYGTVGHQLIVDANGNLTVPGNITVEGSYGSPGGNVTLTSGTFNGNVAGGTISGSTGAFTSDLSAENMAFATGSGGTITAANNAFTVGTGGALSAASGGFAVDSSGDLTIGSGSMTVAAASGNTAIGGNLGVTGPVTVGSSLSTVGVVSIGTTTVATGSSAPLLTVGKKVGLVYPLTVDQYGSVTASAFNGTLNGSVNGGTVTTSGLTASALTSITGAIGTWSTTGNITTVGTITATNFAGGINIGSGGTTTVTGVLPIANGGTGASDAGSALADLGVTSGGYLNTGLLTTNLIPGADLTNASVGFDQLTTTGVTAGTYNNLTVDATGRVTSAANTDYATTTLNDGNGDTIGVGTGGGFVTVGSAVEGLWNMTGLMIGSSTLPINRLDVYGATAIGVPYAGVDTAPANGLIVAGSTGIGTSSPVSALQVVGTVTATNFSGSGAGLTSISTSAITGTLGTANGGTGTNTTFTPGSVVFAGANGIYSQDNANFFWDFTNHRLGIATAVPANALDVNGSLAVGTFAGTGAGASNELVVGGSVGIGTTIPGYPLEVQSTTGSAFHYDSLGNHAGVLINPGPGNGVVTLVRQGTGSQGVVQFASIGTGTWSSPQTYDFSIKTNSTYLGIFTAQANIPNVTFTSTGLMAIGTTSPLVSLDVSAKADAIALPVGNNSTRPTGGNLTNGEIRYNSATPGVEAYINGFWTTLLGSGAGGGATVPQGGTGDITLTAHAVLVGEGTSPVAAAGPGALGSVLIGEGTTSDPIFSPNMTLSGTESLALAGTDLSLTGLQNNVNVGAVSAVRYNGSNTATYTGIIAGTSNVNGEILYLHNASNYTLTLANLNASSTGVNQIITGTGADLPVPTNTSVTLQYDGNGSVWRVTGSSNAAKALAAGSDTQIQYNNQGNMAGNSGLVFDYTHTRVGIGTATPSLALDVNGAILIENGNSLEFNPPSGNASFISAPGSSRLKFSAGGVASFEAHPNALLFPSGSSITDQNSNILLGFGLNASAVNYLILNNAVTGLAPNLAATGSDTNVSIALIPKGSGGIGIGTTAPSQALQVIGNVDTTTGKGYLTEIANDGTTGTTVGKLAKLSSAGAAILTTTADTDGIVGVVIGGAGTTGNAQIAVGGQASCVFDNATVAGDYVSASTGTAGDCTDIGAARSLTSETIGRVLSTNGSAGTYAIAVGLSGSAAASGAPTGTGKTNYTARWLSSTTLGTGTLYDNGTQVGIGTTTPAAPLDVYTSAGIGAIDLGGVNGISYPSTDTTAGASIAIGNGALVEQPLLAAEAYHNTAIGYQTMNSVSLGTTAIQNTVVGYQAGNSITTANDNTFIGHRAGATTTTGGGNVAIGAYAGSGSVSNGGGVAIGYNATLSSQAVTIGQGTGTGNFSVVIGYTAGNALNGASAHNTLIGFFAGTNMSTGTGNIAIGSSAMTGSSSANTTGSNNTVMGSNAGINIQGASAQNTIFGENAGSTITVGTSNTIIGYNVGSVTQQTGQNNILIGTNSGVDTPLSTTSNFLNIGNLIYGTGLATSGTTPTGNVGIGSTSPAALLDVLGSSSTQNLVSLSASGNFRVLNAIRTSNGTRPVVSFINNSGSDTNAVLALNQSNTTALAFTVGSGSDTTNQNFVVLGNGNVGVGTTAPQNQMDVVGTGQTVIAIQSTGTDGNSAELDLDGGGLHAGWAMFTNKSSAGGAVDSLGFYKEFGTTGTKMVIQDNGNVGFGTKTPTNAISLGGTVAQTFWMERNTAAGNNLTVQAGGGVALGTNLNGGTLNLQSGISTGNGSSGINFNIYEAGSSGTADNSATTAMTVLGNGNVGIGTTIPTGLFQIGLLNNSHTAFTVSDVSTVGLVGIDSLPQTNVLLQVGINGSAQGLSAGPGSAGFGIETIPTNNSAGDLWGVYSYPLTQGAGTAVNVGAFASGIRIANASETLTNGYGFNAGSPTITTGTITNLYGLYINPQKVTGVTNGYGVYQTSATDSNYFAGSTNIGTATPNTAALLQLYSTTQGFLPPLWTTANETAAGTSLPVGLVVYNTTNNELESFNGTGWEAVGANSLDAGGSNTQLQYNNNGDLGGTAGLTWDSTNDALTLATIANQTTPTLTLTGGTAQTTSQPVLKITQTWNNAAMNFDAPILENITETAFSNGNLMDLQANGSSKMTVDWIGNIVLASGALHVHSSAIIGWTGEDWMTSPNANDIQFGGADNSAPTAQILSTNSVLAGATDTAGANFTIAGSRGTGTGAGGSIFFQTAPAGTTGTTQNALVTAMTIAPSGNVGIGTTLPGYPLDVVGGIRITEQSAPGILQFYDGVVGSGGPQVISEVVGVNKVNHGSGELEFYTAINNTLTQQMVIDRSGNVGIGTTAPSSLLQVSGNGINPVLSVGPYAGTGFGTINIVGSNSGTVSTATIGGNLTGGLEMNASDGTLVSKSGAQNPHGGAAFQIYGNAAIGTGYTGNSTVAPTNGLIVQGNVGIGTTAPSQLLTVGNSGNFTVSSSGAINDNSNFSVDAGGSVGAQNIKWYGGSGGGELQFGGTTGATVIIRNEADAYAALAISQNNASSTGDILDLAAAGVVKVAFQLGGNVGIGTTAPTQLLTVAGNVDTFSGSGYLTEIPNDGTTGTTVNKLAKLSAAGAAILATTADVDGMVGVVAGGAGTTGNAQIAVGGQVSCVFDGATTAGDYVTISAGTAGDCSDAGAAEPANQTIGRVLSTNVGAGTYAIAVGFIPAADAGGDVTGTGTTNYVARWLSSTTLGTGTLYDNGTQVGIGTTGLVGQLSLYGSGTYGGVISLQNTSNSATAGYTGVNLYAANGTIVGSFAHSSSANTVLPSSTWIGTRNATDPFYIVTGSSTPTVPAVTVLASGNVGIGTTLPTAALSVVGSETLTNPSSATNLTITGTANQGTSDIVDIYSTDLSASNPIFQLMHGASAAFAKFGFLRAIGGFTLTPSTGLMDYNLVEGNGGGTGNGGSAVQFNASGIAFATRAPSSALTTVAGSTDLFINSANGYVGIGTTAPSTLFSNNSATNTVDATSTGHNVSSIDWNMNSAGYVGTFYNSGLVANANGLLIKGAANTTNALLSVDYGSAQATAGTALFRVLGNGKVGIGSAIPSQALDVNGNINVSNGGTIGIIANAALQYTTSNNINFMVSGANRLMIGASIGGGASIETNLLGQYLWSSTGNGNGTQDTGLSRIAAGVVGIGTGITGTTNGTLIAGNVGIGTTAPTQLLTVAGNVDTFSGSGYLTEIPNDGTTGTTLNKLAKLSAAGAAILATTADVDGVIGVVAGGAGTTGNAQIAVGGQVSCVFDGATTAGDYVTISTLTAGDCSDAGAAEPANQTIGRVLSTNVGAGTYVIAITFIPAADAGGDVTGTGTTNYVARWLNSTTLGTGKLYDNGTNVGIGTTAPTSNLHIYGTSLNAPSILLETNATQSGTSFGNSIGFKRTGASNYIQLVEEPAYSDSVSFSLAGSPYTRILNIQQNGNVGIGTTAPSTKLHVSGKTVSSNDSSPLIVGDALFPATGQTGEVKMVLGNTTGRTMLFTGQDATHGLLWTWQYNATAANAYGTIEGFGGNNPLVLQSSGGNVGIGITTPQNLLTVNGAASIGYNIAAPTNGLIVNGNVGIGTSNASSSTLTVVGPNGLTVSSGGLVNAGGGTVAGIPATLTVNSSSTPTNDLAFIVGSTLGPNLVVAAPGIKKVILTSGSSWTVPSDWNSSNNSIEVIGGGGGGARTGGGGGAYAKIMNISLTPSGSVAYQIGSAGTPGSLSVNATAGGDSYFNGTGTTCSAQSVCAKGGAGGNSSSTPGSGGAASGSVGILTYSGSGGASSGGGGGAAAGPNGAGSTAPTTGYGATGDNGYGGVGGYTSAAGGAGGAGAEWGTAGSGGGGGWGNSAGGAGGNYGGAGAGANGGNPSGAAGVIVITYAPSAGGGVAIGTVTPLATLDVEGSNGVILNAGNVGVGTASPGSKLDVFVTSAQDGLVVRSAGPNQPTVLMKDTVNAQAAGFRLAGGSSTAFQMGGGQAGTSISELQFGTDIFATGSNPYLDINTTRFEFLNGNVGIGTTAPTGALEVAGVTYLGNINSTTPANSGVVVYTGNSANASRGIDIIRGTSWSTIGSDMGIHLMSDGSGNYRGALGFTSGSGAFTEQMTFLTSGIGIGTTSSAQKLTVWGNIDAMKGYLTEIPNDGTTGTTLNKLAKLSAAGAAILATTGDVDGMIGVVAGGAGTTGNAQIVVGGQASCVFDGSTTAGDYVTISTGTAGDCSDAGASEPANQTIGRVLGTNVGAGTYSIEMGLIPAADAGGDVTGTGTTNYVARWLNSTTLGTGKLYDNGTNVGIGTTSPSYPLQVGGFTGGGFVAFTGAGSEGSEIVLNSQGANILNGGGNNQSMTFTLPNPGGIFAGNYLFGFTGSTTAFNINNAGTNPGSVTVISANVGIGTTVPQGTLDVEGGTIASGAGSNILLTAQSASASAQAGGSVIIKGGASGAGGTSGWVQLVGGANTNAVSISSGIIYGGVPNGVTALGLQATTTTFTGSSATATNSFAFTNNNNYNTLSTGTYNFAQFTPSLNQTGSAGYRGLQVSAYELGTGSGSKTLIDVGTSSAINGGGTYTSEFNVSDNGTGYFAGNVGIGITSPAYPLVVNTAGSGTTGVQTTVLSVNTVNSSGSGARMVFHQALDEAAITGWDSNNWGGYMTFATAPSTGTSPGGTLTERMRISDAGNVGIGTTTPAYALDVSAGTVAGTVMHVYTNVSTVTPGSAASVSLNSAAVGQMSYYSGTATISGTPDLYVSGTNIGIGTSTPTNLLSLSGSSAQTIWMERGATIGNNLTVQAGGGLSGGSNENGGTLILASGISTGTGKSQIQFNVYPAMGGGSSDNTATTAMTIASTGSVGIGTTVPAVALDVTGAMYSRSVNAGSATSIDWSQGNSQYTTASCGAFTFTNMQDGGTYTLAVEGTTSGTCTFSQSGVTFRMPSNNGATTTGTMTIYSFARMGSYVFVSWTPGY